MKPLKLARQFVLLGISSVVFLLTLALYQRPSVYVAKTAGANDTQLPPTNSPEVQGIATFPIITAQGVYAYDIDSGVILYEKDADSFFLPASTTKIVTALVAMDTFEPGTAINTGEFYVGGSQMGLSWHERITARDLFYGLLIHSGNDAAEVLARAFPQGRAAFINAMNDKVREINAFNTHFVNPSGLDQEGQITTAEDLARIATYAMGKAEFAKIVATERYTAHDVGGTMAHNLVNRNELLGKVPGVLGVKTGWTENARENLVTYIERDGKKVIIALLGSQDRFGETGELIEWIYNSHSSP